MFEAVVASVFALAATRTASRLSEKMHDQVLDEFSARLVGAMIASQDEQLNLIRGIDAKVAALVESDYRSALQFLRAAARRDRGPDERMADLGKARDRFFDAIGTEGHNPARAALIQLHLGLTYVAMDDWIDAEEALELAYVAALEATHGTVRRSFFKDENRAGTVMPLLERVRDARIALGALPTTVPAFHLYTGPSSYPLSLLSLQFSGGVDGTGPTGEATYRLAATKQHADGRLFAPLPPELQAERERRDALFPASRAGVDPWITRVPYWEYLMMLPTATLAAVAAGESEASAPLGPEALGALRDAIGPGNVDPHTERFVTVRSSGQSHMSPLRELAASMAEPGGLRSLMERWEGLAEYRVVAAEIVHERRANWPLRHRQRLPHVAG